MTQYFFDEKAVSRIGEAVRKVENANITGNLPYAATRQHRGTFSRPAKITVVGTDDIHKFSFSLIDFEEDTASSGYTTEDETDDWFVLDLTGQSREVGDLVWIEEHNGKWIIPAGGGSGCDPANEKQYIHMNGPPTGGTFTLTVMGYETGDLDYDITLEDLTTAIESLTPFSEGDIECTGGFPTAVCVEFKGDYVKTLIDVILPNGQGLEGSGTGMFVIANQRGRA